MADSQKLKQSSQNLVWIDLEMTGLDPEKEVIVQAAVIITDGELNHLESLSVDVWQPDHALTSMVPFVRKMHEKTGLTDRVRSSTIDVGAAEQQLMEVVCRWCPYRPVLCGNSIGSDRKFIDKYMPTLSGYLHYRMVDVSSIKVLAGMWHPEATFEKPRGLQHDALFDIQQSIAELAHYRKKIFRGAPRPL